LCFRQIVSLLLFEANVYTRTLNPDVAPTLNEFLAIKNATHNISSKTVDSEKMSNPELGKGVSFTWRLKAGKIIVTSVVCHCLIKNSYVIPHTTTNSLS